ncbi:MAG TPA: hypothetical protein V6C58_12565 [Allocoleopsis sp.]
MKNLLSNISKASILGIISIFALNIKPVLADHYWSSAPTPPELPEFQNLQYVTDTVDGTGFYYVSPFYYKQTADKNIFVSSVIVMKDGDNANFSYVQINCGNQQYREILPWINVDLYNSNMLIQEPSSYNWKYFTLNSAFQSTGKTLCEGAANDMGLTWER